MKIRQNSAKKSDNKPRHGVIKKAELIFIAVALALSGAWFAAYRIGRADNRPIAQIFVDGKLAKQVDLSRVKEKQVITVQGKLQVVLEAESGSIRFVASQCPDKICVQAGALTKPPHTAVCLPARVSVRVVSNEKGSLDAIA